MRNLNPYSKKLYAGVVLSAVAVVIGVAIFGALWKGEADDGGNANALELTHETGHGHNIVEEAHVPDGGPHDTAVTHEDEASGVFEITLDAGEWRFEPSVVEVPVGHRVKLTLVNHGLVEHDVEVVGILAEDIEVVGGVERHARLGGGHHNESVIAAHAEPGTTASVIFTATEAGEYDFACTIPGHKEAGMVGKLVVTE